MVISFGGKLRLAKNVIVVGYYKDRFRLIDPFQKVTRLVTVNVNFNDWASRLGQIIRKFNIEDFSQFYYIFLVSMPIIGARSHMHKHPRHFAEYYKEYITSPFVKPDFSGWAGLYGFLKKVKDVYFLEKRVEYEPCYAENCPMYFDMPNICLTVLTTKGDKNAF